MADSSEKKEVVLQRDFLKFNLAVELLVRSGKWIARQPEFNLEAEGTTPEDAKNNLKMSMLQASERPRTVITKVADGVFERRVAIEKEELAKVPASVPVLEGDGAKEPERAPETPKEATPLSQSAPAKPQSSGTVRRGKRGNSAGNYDAGNS